VLSLFDPAFGAYWPLLWCLMGIMVLNALTGATVLLMQVGGMHWQQVALQGGFLLASLAALPWLAAAWGVYGVALAFGLSKLLWNLAAILLIRRNLGVDPSLAGLARGGGLAGALALGGEARA
jgi:O-antigen/teichoic acid export membrane protein